MPIILLASLGPLGSSLADSNETLANIIQATPGAAMNELVRIGWFGFDGPEAETSTLAFNDVWSAAAEPLIVMVAWTAVAISLAKRSMRWEPRS
jgi:ABC-2 type transport system permease protein